MDTPLNKLHIVITGAQGHGKTMALQAIADAMDGLGFQVWVRDSDGIAYDFAKGGDKKGPLYLSVARIETKYPE